MANKYYKVFDNNKNRAIIMPQKGYDLVMNNASLSKGLDLIGECDELGNCLEEIAEGNFMSSKPLKTNIAVLEPKKRVTIKEPTKQVVKEVDGLPVGNIDYQPTAEQIKKKAENDKLAEKAYKEKREEMLKKVSTKPIDKNAKEKKQNNKRVAKD